MYGCPMCERSENFNEIIFESENFYVSPALGQIVEGYLLINTKEHYIGLSHIPKELFLELKEVQDEVKEVLSQHYTKPIFFEHGCVSETKRGGCCIVHAHLHAVPFEIDILEDIAKNFRPRRIGDISELVSQSERCVAYFYYENQIGEKYIFELKEPAPPQYIRQIIAVRAKKPDKWDWREFPEWDRLHNTIARLKGKKV